MEEITTTSSDPPGAASRIPTRSKESKASNSKKGKCVIAQLSGLISYVCRSSREHSHNEIL